MYDEQWEDELLKAGIMCDSTRRATGNQTRHQYRIYGDNDLQIQFKFNAGETHLKGFPKTVTGDAKSYPSAGHAVAVTPGNGGIELVKRAIAYIIERRKFRHPDKTSRLKV